MIWSKIIRNPGRDSLLCGIAVGTKRFLPDEIQRRERRADRAVAHVAEHTKDAVRTDRIFIRYLEIPETVGFAEVSRYLALISPGRRTRIGRFLFDRERLTSLFAELLLRVMLTETMGMDEADIAFCEGSSGKPFLARGAAGEPAQGTDVQFSLSHSGRQVAAAVCRQSVGLDLETLRSCDLHIADRFFLPEESRYIRGAENPDEAFFYIWTRKEAYIKKTGEGLSRDLRSFSVLRDDPPRFCWQTCRTGTAVISVCADSISEERVSVTRTDCREVLAHFESAIC